MTTKSTNNRQLGADLSLLLVTLIWGSTFVMVKDAVSSYPVFPFLTLRFGLATLALLIIGGKHLPSLGWRGVGSGILIGLFLFGGYAFQTVGLQYTSASKAGFITGLSVVIVPLLSTLILKRIPARAALIGVGLATLGLALLTLNRDLSIVTGDVIVLGCAFSFALHIIAVSKFAPRWNALALALVQVATVAVISALISLWGHRPWPAPAPATWFAAGFTGMLATALAFAVQTQMQRFTTPTHTALIFAAEPVFAAVFGVLLAGDELAGRVIAGGTLIVVGTIVSEIRWSERTAALVSRFLAPPYVAVPLLLLLGVCDPVSWVRGLLWAMGIGLFAVGGAMAVLWRELRKGAISDWHISAREERLQPIPVMASLIAAITPFVLLLVFDGPKLLFLGCLSAILLVVVNLLVTIRWKISQHASGIALATTLVTGVLGISAAPVMLLIPLVAWSRVKIGAHTVLQTIAGGAVGVLVTIGALGIVGML
jgi:drug/metabolite transporter (DMT)-like permease